MKLFKTKEEKVKIILAKYYPELYNLTKEEIAQIKINLNNINWGEIGKDKIYSLFKDMNRREYDHIVIVKKEYYSDGIVIDGIKSATKDYRYDLIVMAELAAVYCKHHTITFNSIEEIHKFIWGM